MTLYITEKSSQVKPLMKALRKNNMASDAVIKPLAGHILELYDFKDYDKSLDDSWQKLIMQNKVPFFPKELKKKIKKATKYGNYKQQFEEIKKAIQEADRIILATDPDNEGATLGMEVIEKANGLHKVAGMINMSKLDDESLSKEVRVFDKLPYKNMYAAGDARAYYDQTFGFNLTMFATVLLGKNRQLLNIGGVKLPTIRMVVERDLQFEQFKEIPFYTIKGIANKDGHRFPITIYTNDTRFDKKEDAEAIVKQITSSNPILGKIDKYTEKTRTQQPPKPYSLTDLQSETNKLYKINADNTLKIAQKLYADDRIQSYPRTDCNYYSEGEYKDAPKLLRKLNDIEYFQNTIQHIQNIDTPLKRAIFNDKKVTAHTALSPTLEISRENYTKLNDLEKKVFNLVAKRYIIQFLNDYKYLDISGEGTIQNDIKFKFSDHETIEVGYKVATNFDPKKRVVPKLKPGDEVIIESVSIEEGFTKPKPRFTEATLLQAMEKVYRFFDDPKIKEQLGEKGIGTPATRAKILEDLKTAKKGDEPYFKVVKGKIISTNKARNLIATLPKDMSSPILRANMEEKLNQIVSGQLTKEEYYKEIQKLIIQLIEEIKKEGTMPENKPTKDVTLTLTCPVCGGDIIQKENVFKCENNIYKNGKQSGCKFMIVKHQKLLDKDLTEQDLEDLLAGKEVKGNNGNSAVLDLTNKFFTKINFAKGTSPKADPNKLIETPKTYRLGDKWCFKNCFGKPLKPDEAKKILSGEEVKLKRRSKTGKPYEVYVRLAEANDGTFEHKFAS